MNHKLDTRSKVRCVVQLSLGAAALASCAADSGAVEKPLVFESSAKRAAAVSSGPQHDVSVAATAGTVASVAQQPVGAGSGATSTSTSTSAAMGQAASTSPAKAAAGAMAAAAAGAGAPPASTTPASTTPRGSAGSAGSMQPSAAGSTAANQGAPATEGGAPKTMGATACTMEVTYNAVGMHGMWYPHNIGAVWVEDTNGKFIKTLERWAGIRAGYLSHWNMREDQHGKWPSCPFANLCTGAMVPDQMDVMTQATIFEDNAMHRAKWSCKNVAGEVVPDGKYKLFFEEMENIYPNFAEGPLGMIEFEKGPNAVTLMPPDQAPYKNLKIVIEPTAH